MSKIDVDRFYKDILHAQVEFDQQAQEQFDEFIDWYGPQKLIAFEYYKNYKSLDDETQLAACVAIGREKKLQVKSYVEAMLKPTFVEKGVLGRLAEMAAIDAEMWYRRFKRDILKGREINITNIDQMYHRGRGIEGGNRNASIIEEDGVFKISVRLSKTITVTGSLPPEKPEALRRLLERAAKKKIINDGGASYSVRIIRGADCKHDVLIDFWEERPACAFESPSGYLCVDLNFGYATVSHLDTSANLVNWFRMHTEALTGDRSKLKYGARTYALRKLARKLVRYAAKHKCSIVVENFRRRQGEHVPAAFSRFSTSFLDMIDRYAGKRDKIDFDGSKGSRINYSIPVYRVPSKYTSRIPALTMYYQLNGFDEPFTTELNKTAIYPEDLCASMFIGRRHLEWDESVTDLHFITKRGNRFVKRFIKKEVLQAIMGDKAESWDRILYPRRKKKGEEDLKLKKSFDTRDKFRLHPKLDVAIAELEEQTGKLIDDITVDDVEHRVAA